MSIIFLKAAYGKINGFEKTVLSMEKYGIPFSTFFLICAISLLIIGGILVLSGFKPQLGAVALIIFLVPVTIIYHFDPESSKQMGQFYKNTGLIGGLLMLAAHGGGKYGLESWLKRRRKY